MESGDKAKGVEMAEAAAAQPQTFHLLNLREELERDFEEEKGAGVMVGSMVSEEEKEAVVKKKTAPRKKTQRTKNIVDFRKLAAGGKSRKTTNVVEAYNEEDKIRNISDKIALTFEAWMRDFVEKRMRPTGSGSLTTPLMMSATTTVTGAKDYTGPWCGGVSDLHFKSVVKHFGHGDAGAVVLMRALVQKINKEEIEDAVIPQNGPNTLMVNPKRALDESVSIDTLKGYGTHLHAGDGLERGNIDVYRLNLLDPISPVMIGRFAHTKNDTLLNLHCVRAILGAGWQEIKSFYTANFCVLAVALASIAWSSYRLVNKEDPALLAVALQWGMAFKASVELVCEESYALWRHMSFQREVLAETGDNMTCFDFVMWRLRYFARALRLRFIDLILVFVEFEGALAVTSTTLIDFGRPLKNGMFALAALAYWVRLLYVVQAYRPLGPRMLPLIYAAADMAPMLILLLFALGAATHMFYVAGAWTDNDASLYGAFMVMFRLGLLHNFDLQELEGATTYYNASGKSGELWPHQSVVSSQSYWTIHVIFLFVSVFFSVLLSNLLIGFLSSNYEVYSAVAGQLFARRRAKVIVQTVANPLYWVWRPLVLLRKCCCYRKARDGQRLYEKNKHSVLFFSVSCDAADADDGNAYSLRRSLMLRMSAETEKLERHMVKLDSNVRSLGNKMYNIETNMANNNGEMSRLLAEISEQID